MMEYLASLNPLLPTVAATLGLAVVAVLADLLAKRVLLALALRIARSTQSRWDDALVDSGLFGRLAWVVPAIVVIGGIRHVPGLPETVTAVVRNVAGAWIIVAVMLAVVAALKAANTLYERRPDAKERPIKGFLQLGEIIVYGVGVILVISALIDRSPVILLSGLGAMTAVLMIVFKDTLLSLAASIQLTSQRIVRVGDWLEAPQFGADGDVVDVALYTVTVQNWDKTLTTIPTHRLIGDAFKNWRGMQEAGGRRIKRSVFIDVQSIRFLEPEEVERFRRFRLLRDYIGAKEKELRAYNAAIGASEEAAVNLRRLTNLGTLRAYIVAYLRHHPAIREDMTLIVRQLQPGPTGLPLEIYCFTDDTNWVAYEGIQSDLFDHVCAIVPEFGLRLFQNPAGTDIARLGSAAGVAGAPEPDRGD